MDPLTVMGGLAALAGIGSAWYSHQRVGAVQAQAVRLRRELNVERHAAMHDPLTGLPNRRAFYQSGAVLLADESRRPLIAVVVDLDDFKQVNDTYGHAAGDQALVILARRLASLVGDGFIARLGGDEFVGLFHSESVDEEWLDAAAGILAGTMAAPMQIAGHTISVTTSVGLAPAQTSTDLDDVLHRADLAMYRAKSRRSLTGSHTAAAAPRPIRPTTLAHSASSHVTVGPGHPAATGTQSLLRPIGYPPSRLRRVPAPGHNGAHTSDINRPSTTPAPQRRNG